MILSVKTTKINTMVVVLLAITRGKGQNVNVVFYDASDFKVDNILRTPKGS